MQKLKVLLGACLVFVIGCALEGEYNLGGGYYLLGDGANTTISKMQQTRRAFYNDIILGRIVDCTFDKDYILVFRNASERAKVYFNLQDSLWKKQKGKDTLQFWIIDKSDGTVYGPMEKEEYLRKREYLKIPKDVKLKEE